MRRITSHGGGEFGLWRSPIGWVGVVAFEAGLAEIVLCQDADEVCRRIAECHPAAVARKAGAVARALAQLEEYFRGSRSTFDLPLDFSALPPFTAAVLRTLAAVPFGRTVTYGELAVLTGRPGAARAVGRAMAVNPFLIVVPCHRVLGAGGQMTGYSGGEGIATKEWLLRFEAKKDDQASRPVWRSAS